MNQKQIDENVKNSILYYESFYKIMVYKMENGNTSGAVGMLGAIREFDKKFEGNKHLFTEKQLRLLKSLPEMYKEEIEKLEKFI